MALPARVAREEKLYTSDEFMALAVDPDKKHELVGGVVKEMLHPGEEHLLVQDNLQFALGSFVRAKRLGRVLPPGSFELKIDPERDNVRSPDLAYLTKDKITGQSGAIRVIPDLAVEVYSPNDRPGEYIEKFRDYQKAGWNLIWLVYPPKSAPKRKAGKVEIYHLQQSLEPVKTLAVGDILDGETTIPGFNLAVADLFNFEV